jgi:hypothetical protein
MKTVLIFLSLVFSGACAVSTVESQKMPNAVDPAETPAAAEKPAAPNQKSPVLVELFTSEGCSSCPPADKALAFLEREQPLMQAEIVTLALHVDYWNHLGWKDEFSSPLYSRRQEFYAQKFKLNSTYTPQMVVDGSFEFTGSNLGKATETIIEAARAPKAAIAAVRRADRIELKIDAMPVHQAATVFLAVAEDNLSSQVGRGENKGQKLEHVSVVRELTAVATITAEAHSLAAEIALPKNPKWKSGDLKAVVFIQENNSRKILGLIKVLLE